LDFLARERERWFLGPSPRQGSGVLDREKGGGLF
jgi:hypothetical protein